MAKLAVAVRSGLVSSIGRIVAVQLSSMLLDPSALASAPNRGVFVVMAKDVEPIPSIEAVSSGLFVVMAHDAMPDPLLINSPTMSATVKVIALSPVVVMPPTPEPDAPNSALAKLTDDIPPAVFGNTHAEPDK